MSGGLLWHGISQKLITYKEMVCHMKQHLAEYLTTFASLRKFARKVTK